MCTTPLVPTRSTVVTSKVFPAWSMRLTLSSSLTVISRSAPLTVVTVPDWMVGYHQKVPLDLRRDRSILLRRYNLDKSAFSNASLVGTKTVKGPSPSSVDTKSASLKADKRSLKSSSDSANSTMLPASPGGSVGPSPSSPQACIVKIVVLQPNY